MAGEGWFGFPFRIAKAKMSDPSGDGCHLAGFELFFRGHVGIRIFLEIAIDEARLRGAGNDGGT